MDQKQYGRKEEFSFRKWRWIDTLQVLVLGLVAECHLKSFAFMNQ